MNRDDEKLIEQVRASLDRSEADISMHAATRLRQARHAAIASRYHRTTPVWMPAIAAAMLVLVAGLAWFTGVSRVEGLTPLPAQQAAADFEMLVHGEDLELFADLDFYLWLEQRDGHAG